MPDETKPLPPPDGPDEPPWDPHQILRDRTAASRQDRDQSFAELRSGMGDDEIREEFGIDLGEIES
ncbi:MAG TPA: hypothetical protein VIT42_16870 [Microlunatus sp.]